MGNVILAVTHETGHTDPTADRTGQGGELHAARCHPRVVTVYGHHAVADGQYGRNAFTTTAGRHGIVNNTVKIVVIQRLTRGLVQEVVAPFPLSKFRIQTFPLVHGLIRPGRIDLEGGFTIHPVVGTAQPGSFRADDTDVVRRKGLAKGTRVEGLRGLVGHPLDTGVSVVIHPPRLFENLVHLVFLRVELYLDFVKNSTEVLMKLGMEDIPDMLDLQTL